MPRYTFKVHDGADGVNDEGGVKLPNRDLAVRYGYKVIRELMKNRELQTRSWRLDICEDGHETIAEILFASADATLDHMHPTLRSMMEQLCERRRTFAEVVHEAHLTVREARALVARSRGKPYVAAEHGRSTIR